MLEIGGYLDMEKYHGLEYHDSALRLNLARNCLELLIKNRNIKKIFLPNYLCESIYVACKNSGINVEYYKIDNKLRPVIECELKKNEYIYIINYYGLLSDEYILSMKEKYNNIIVDNVQDFFRKPIMGIDTIYSCRKYFGVTDGAYIYTNIDVNIKEVDNSYDRLLYMCKRFENSAQEAFEEYQENEKKLDSEKIKGMSKITRNILKSLDYKYIKDVRTKNFNYLAKSLNRVNKLDLDEYKCDGPYMYPFYCQNGIEIRKKLISNKVYIARLWPGFDGGSNFDMNYQEELSNNILPIPCDQRYTEKEMQKIIDIIQF